MGSATSGWTQRGVSRWQRESSEEDLFGCSSGMYCSRLLLPTFTFATAT